MAKLGLHERGRELVPHSLKTHIFGH